MKSSIHPQNYRPVVFSDFTGEEKIIDTEGRVDRFKARQAAAEARKAALANKAKKAAANKAAKTDAPKSDKKAKKSSK